MSVSSPLSRAQAIATGALVDVTPTAREFAFSYPLAFTRAAFSDCIAWESSPAEEQQQRLGDVLSMFRLALARRTRIDPPDRVRFTLLRTVQKRCRRVTRTIELEAVCSLGDVSEPVVTIRKVGEG